MYYNLYFPLNLLFSSAGYLLVNGDSCSQRRSMLNLHSASQANTVIWVTLLGNVIDTNNIYSSVSCVRHSQTQEAGLKRAVWSHGDHSRLCVALIMHPSLYIFPLTASVGVPSSLGHINTPVYWLWATL